MLTGCEQVSFCHLVFRMLSHMTFPHHCPVKNPGACARAVMSLRQLRPFSDTRRAALFPVLPSPHGQHVMLREWKMWFLEKVYGHPGWGEHCLGHRSASPGRNTPAFTERVPASTQEPTDCGRVEGRG